jgi:hypothetical protein
LAGRPKSRNFSDLPKQFRRQTVLMSDFRDTLADCTSITETQIIG